MKNTRKIKSRGLNQTKYNNYNVKKKNSSNNRPTKIYNSGLRSSRISHLQRYKQLPGGGQIIDTKTQYNTFFFEKLSTQPNIDNTFEEIGIVSIINSQGINMLRSSISKLARKFGQIGYSMSVYNYAVNQLIEKVNDEMVKRIIDKISNVKIHVEFPSSNEIICQFNGTALRKKNSPITDQ